MEANIEIGMVVVSITVGVFPFSTREEESNDNQLSDVVSTLMDVMLSGEIVELSNKTLLNTQLSWLRQRESLVYKFNLCAFL